MKQNSTDASDNASLASVESDLLGVMFSFPRKVKLLMEKAKLDDAGTTAATEKIHQILENITADITRTKEFNIKERLDVAYEEMQRYLQALAEPEGADDPTDGAARNGS